MAALVLVRILGLRPERVPRRAARIPDARPRRPSTRRSSGRSSTSIRRRGPTAPGNRAGSGRRPRSRRWRSWRSSPPGTSRASPGPYRETIEQGIRYVLAHQRSNGLLVSNSSHGPMYCHGISTLMLAEVVGMTADPELAEQAPRGPGARGQADRRWRRTAPRTANHAGGWRYQPTSRRQRHQRHRLAAHGPPRRQVGRLRGPLREHRPRHRLPQALRRQARRRLRLPARRRPEQPPDRHRHPRPGDLRRAPDPRGRRRRRVPAQAPAAVVQPRTSSTRSITAR